jgi:Mg-chelatase subunit ChlD
MTDCQRIDAALAADPAALEAELEAHLGACERCRWVSDRLGRLLTAPAEVERARRRAVRHWAPMGAAAGLFVALAAAAVLWSPQFSRSPENAVRAIPDPAPAAPQAELEQTAMRMEEEVALPRAGSQDERFRIRRQLSREGSPGMVTGPNAPPAAPAPAASPTARPAPYASRARISRSARRVPLADVESGSSPDDLDALLAGATGGSQGEGSGSGSAGSSSVGATAETLSRTQIVAGISAIRPRVQACNAQYRVPGTANVDITISRTGRIQTAAVTGKFAGTPTGLCLEKAVRGATFPRFAGPPITISYPLVMSETESSPARPKSGGGGGEPPLDPNAYLQNTYVPGLGSRDRTDALVAAGVTVGSTTLKLDTFSKSLRQPFRPPAETALALHAALDRSRARGGGDSVVLQVGLQATDRAPRPERVNLVLALDVSGSMADDDKLRHAKVAARDLIATLRPSDRVAIVAYDDTQRVLVAPGPPDVETAAERIAELSASGSTDIHAALTLAYDLALRLHAPAATTRVILLSDGQVTVGISEKSAFDRIARAAFEAGITTSAIGVGLQYDDELMAFVGRSGRGSYHFLADAAAIAPTMRAEVESLGRPVASAVMVRVLLAEGVRALRVLGQPALEALEVAEVKHEEAVLDVRAARERGIVRDRGPKTSRDSRPCCRTSTPRRRTS